MSRPEEGDFLGRWSARKLKAREEVPAPEPAVPVAEPAAEGAPAPDAPERTDEEILQELGLPDPDTLVKGDDFKAFLRSAVPARIRKRALRRLWLSDPVLANLDGLNDYDQDFTDAATVVKDLKTAYTVGRGFLRDTPPEGAEAGLPSPAADGAEADSGSVDSALEAERPETGQSVAERSPEPDAAGSPAEGPRHAAASGGDAPEVIAADDDGVQAPGSSDPAPRAARMRFRFDAG